MAFITSLFRVVQSSFSVRCTDVLSGVLSQRSFCRESDILQSGPGLKEFISSGRTSTNYDVSQLDCNERPTPYLEDVDVRGQGRKGTTTECNYIKIRTNINFEGILQGGGGVLWDLY